MVQINPSNPFPLLLALLLAALLACSSGCIGQGLPLDKIQLPEGFEIDVYAEGVDGARSLALGPGGTLFVGTREAGKVYAILDQNGDFKADRIVTLAEGLNLPNGVAFRNGDLYVAEVDRVLKFEDIENRLDNPPEPLVIKSDLPSERSHGWKFIRFGPDGKLYLPIGAPCNVCDPGDPYATINRMSPDGSGFEVYARGVRNTVGFDWSPEGELWFTDNGRDWLGDDLPSDELNRAPRPGLNFGFPYCHQGDLPDPQFGSKRDCSDFEPPAAKLGAHVAALGMRFYRGEMFPPQYRNQVFIAEHGSWNRADPVGYRIVVARILNNSVTDTEVFADGWLENGLAWGRPVDVEVMSDGSMLVSDDRAGAIYRISYSRSERP